ncbi:MAG: hypothetical protein N2544_04210 [Burkholderiales bacterium]|nr:hypothetical protein [Burkholderiales bacterium]
MKPPTEFGPRPWQQTSWDARAATNFILGGTGTGLLVAAACFFAPQAGWRVLAALGLVSVAGGLGAVWFELGRPWRFANVALNPRTSWMTREAYASGFVFAFGAAAVATGAAWPAWLAALAALAFVYCQSRMLRAAKGIPAWRVRELTPFIVTTGLAEGTGLALALAPALAGGAPRWVGAFFLAVVVGRIGAWLAYLGAASRHAAPRARAGLEAAGRHVVVLGTVIPVVAAAVAFALPAVAAVALALGGLAALAAGWRAKHAIVLRAGFNQGFALPALPVRGAR